jgi:hypothetical protein
LTQIWRNHAIKHCHSKSSNRKVVTMTSRSIFQDFMRVFVIYKVKLRLSLCLIKHHAMNNLHHSWTHVPAALPPEKSPRDQLDWRLGGLQGRSGRCGEEKNF